MKKQVYVIIILAVVGVVIVALVGKSTQVQQTNVEQTTKPGLLAAITQGLVKIFA